MDPEKNEKPESPERPSVDANPSLMEKDIEERMRRLDEIRGLETDGVEVCGSVYRYQKKKGQGKPTREAVGKIYEVYDDDQVGEEFGPGQYQIVYVFSNAETEELVQSKSYYYCIGNEYLRIHKQFLKANGFEEEPTETANKNSSGMLGGMLSSPDNIQNMLLVVKMLKEVFAPPPSIDIAQVISAVATLTNRNSPQISDTIVAKALEMSQRELPPQPSLLEQLQTLKTAQEMFGDGASGNDDMTSILMQKGLELLPMLLQKNNGDAEKVAREFKASNKNIVDLVTSDENLTRQFFETATKKLGIQTANKLAAGFGLKLDRLPKKQAASQGVQ